MLNERRNRRRYLEQEREAGTLCIKKVQQNVNVKALELLKTK